MGIRACIVIFILSFLIWGFFKGYAIATSEFREIEKLTNEERKGLEEEIERPQLEYNGEGLRNPFKKLVENINIKSASTQVTPEPGGKSMKSLLPQLNIQGIVWGGEFPQAIINNKVVKIGDSIEGCVVKDINKKGVTLLFGGFEYNLPPPSTGGKI
jgi:hypothetical protein